jgi:hypothetical protein
MSTFTIENDSNNIILHASLAEAETVPGAERFSSAEELTDLAAKWSTARLADIWNSLPGVAAVSKFKDKKTAVTRIWNAIQSLREEPQPGSGDVQECAEREGETVAEVLEAAYEAKAEPTGEQVATPESVETEPATPEPDANVGEQAPDVAPAEEKATKKATGQPKTPTGEKSAKGTREGSKTEQAIALMKAPGGTTLKTLMNTFNWQANSVRGFISGTLTKKMGLAVVSTKGEDGQRTYTIAS